MNVPATSRVLAELAAGRGPGLGGGRVALSRGRRFAATRLLPGLRSAAASLRAVAVSPVKLTLLADGSALITLAYIGGLGAIEAALVAGLTGIGLPPGPAVSAVLTYRLATYWLPVVPGWAAWRLLQRRDYV